MMSEMSARKCKALRMPRWTFNFSSKTKKNTTYGAFVLSVVYYHHIPQKKNCQLEISKEKGGAVFG